MTKNLQFRSAVKRQNAVDPPRPFVGRPLSHRDVETVELICDVLNSVEKMLETRRRDWALLYLERVYRAFQRWKSQGCARSAARRLRRLYRIKYRKRAHPSRVLMDVTSPTSDRKQKSRWTRVIEAADAERIPTCKFAAFVRKNGGLAGVARLVAKPKSVKPKRNDWVE